eukprot:evm.model.scf_1935.3 EVM.evm.TU.scf_1935.3   scf_1935:17010-21965(+)
MTRSHIRPQGHESKPATGDPTNHSQGGPSGCEVSQPAGNPAPAPQNGLPWTSLLTFWDPAVESDFQSVCLPPIRMTDLISIAFTFVAFVAHTMRIGDCMLPPTEAWATALLAPACGAALLVWIVATGNTYERSRSVAVSLHRIALVMAITAHKACLPRAEESLAGVWLRLVVHSGAFPLLLLPLAHQVPFCVHIWVHAATAVAANLTSSIQCRLWFDSDVSKSILSDIASRMDDVINRFLMLSPAASLPARRLDGASSCWLLTCALQWCCSLVATAVMYCVEAKARAAYLVTRERCMEWGRERIWRAAREAMVVAAYGLIVGPATAFVVLRMIAEFGTEEC